MFKMRSTSCLSRPDPARFEQLGGDSWAPDGPLFCALVGMPGRSRGRRGSRPSKRRCWTDCHNNFAVFRGFYEKVLGLCGLIGIAIEIEDQASMASALSKIWLSYCQIPEKVLAAAHKFFHTQIYISSSCLN